MLFPVNTERDAAVIRTLFTVFKNVHVPVNFFFYVTFCQLESKGEYEKLTVKIIKTKMNLIYSYVHSFQIYVRVGV